MQQSQNQEYTKLKCKLHPSQIYIGISLDKDCHPAQRLKCFQCFQSSNSIQKYNDIRITLFEPPLKFFNLNQTFNQATKSLFDIPEFNIVEEIETLIKLLTDRLNKIKGHITDIFKQYNEINLLKSTLKHQYDMELEKLKEYLLEISKSELPINYNELESMVQNYVELYYYPKNQEILETLDKIREQQTQPNLDQFQLLTNCSQILHKNINDSFDRLNYYHPCRGHTISNPMLIKILKKIAKPGKFKLKSLYKGVRVDTMEDQRTLYENTLLVCRTKKGHRFGEYKQNKSVKGQHFKDQVFDNSAFLFSDFKCENYLKADRQEQLYPADEEGFQCYKKACEMIWTSRSPDLQINSITNCISDLGQGYSTKGFVVDNPHTHLMGEQQPELIEVELLQLI